MDHRDRNRLKEKIKEKNRGGHSPLLAHWLLVPGDWFQIPVGEENFNFLFVSPDLMIAFYYWLNCRHTSHKSSFKVDLQ